MDMYITRIFDRMYSLKPVDFYPYTSCVMERVVDIPYDNVSRVDYTQMMRDMTSQWNLAGIKCSEDNKVVFGFEIYGRKMYLGFYDGGIALGFSVKTDRR